MTHDERQRLINLPITFRIVPSRSYAGTFIAKDVPAYGRRLMRHYNHDDTNYDGVSADEYIKQIERGQWRP